MQMIFLHVVDETPETEQRPMGSMKIHSFSTTYICKVKAWVLSRRRPPLRSDPIKPPLHSHFNGITVLQKWPFAAVK